ncbi:putative ribonuclease H-like domain-containing protein [Tanacetum coccineum]
MENMDICGHEKWEHYLAHTGIPFWEVIQKRIWSREASQLKVANQKYLGLSFCLVLKFPLYEDQVQEGALAVLLDVRTAYGASISSGHILTNMKQTSSYSLLVAMISMRMKKFYKKTEGVELTVTQKIDEQEKLCFDGLQQFRLRHQSEETHESIPVPVVNEPKVVSEPKVWSDAFLSVEVNTARTSGTNTVNTARHNFNRQTVPTNAARKVNTVKPIVNNARPKAGFHKSVSPFRKSFNRTTTLRTNFSKQKVNTAEDYPHKTFQNKGIVDSGCSRHMTGNKAYLTEYQDFNGGPISFRGSKGYITGKGKIKTGKLDFEDVCFVKELQHFNLFSVSQICDKKNKVLFTDSECLVLSPKFKLPDPNQVLFRILKQNNMYSFPLENLVPSGGLACLIAKATIDESNKWHRKLGHVNFKNINKLVKGNLIRGLPSKIFQNDHTCVACQKGKQHKASCKSKSVSSISQPLHLLHMDLFGPTSVRSLNHKTYCRVITDDFSRCDNGTEFKNRDFIEFCGSKGIKREYSNARTPQQNGVAERKNRTLIEAARTMLADSFLPNTFWAEAVSTACYVLNRVLVTKPQNKTPYELITGKIPIISYIRPFGCHVTILNTIDHLGKFDGKSDEGFLVGYSLQSKAFRVQEANHNAGTEDNIDAGDSEIEAESAQDYFVLPIWSSYTSTVKSSKAKNAGEEPNKHPDLKTDEKPVDKEDQVFLDELERLKRQEQDANDAAEALRKEFAQDTEDLLLQAGAAKASSTNIVNTASTPVCITSPYGGLSFTDLTNTDQDDSEIPALEEIYNNPIDGIFTNAFYDDEGAVADFTNLETIVNISPIPTLRINSIHPSTLILGDPKSTVQTRSKVTKSSRAHAFVDAMQEELLQFKIQKVWTLVDLPYGKKAIGTKWVYRNKKDERGVVVRNKASYLSTGTFVPQPMSLRFVDPKYPKKVYKVVKALYGLHQAPRACVKTASTPIETHKPLVKDEETSDVDVTPRPPSKCCKGETLGNLHREYDAAGTIASGQFVESNQMLRQCSISEHKDLH